MLDDIFAMIPIVIASLLGSFSQDFILHASSKARDEKLSKRFGKIFVSIITTVAIVGFGGSLFSITKSMDWKLFTFIAFIFGFTGYRIGEFFATTLGGLELIGQTTISSMMEFERKKAELEKLNSTKSNDKAVIIMKLQKSDEILPRKLEDHLKKSNTLINDPLITEIISLKEELRKHLKELD